MRCARIAVLCGATIALATPVHAQDTSVMMPEQSTAKAKELLQAAIQGLGGDAYLNVRDVTCTYRQSQFGHSGELTGYGKLIEYDKPPDKDRTENSGKRNIIEVFNGDKGWLMDRGGVQDASAEALKEHQDNQKKDVDNILRSRWKEKGVILRYGGTDVVDLKQSDWVELSDSEGRTIRFAFDQATHLPIREVVVTRDPSTRLRIEEITYYSNYHPIQGIQTPFQASFERNGLKQAQLFVQDCKYNSGVDDSLFTKQSLEDRWAKVGKKKPPKDNKKTNN